MVDDEKYAIRFKIDQQEVDLTLDTFRTILQLPQVTTEKPFAQPAEFITIEKFLKIVGYEGGVTYATKFLIKHLTQPWETLFKLLNRYTTTRLMRLDQTKINTLQMFHALVNNHHVDYERIIWNDLVIPDEFLTREIKKTESYKDYDADYNGMKVPMTQSSLIEKEQLSKAQQVSLAKTVRAKDNNQEDPDTRLEHGSYKKSPEEKKDVDDDHHHHIDDSLVKKKNMGSQETREAKKQTPILTPLDHLGLTYRRLRNKQLN
ncbi:hypothetical protein Tco_0865551 [Tanacetum coccineum]